MPARMVCNLGCLGRFRRLRNVPTLVALCGSTLGLASSFRWIPADKKAVRREHRRRVLLYDRNWVDFVRLNGNVLVTSKLRHWHSALGTLLVSWDRTGSPDPLGPYTVSFMASATVPESLSATRIVFGNVYQTASKTVNVTVTNKAATGSIRLTGASVGGVYPDDFKVTGGSCSGALAASSSCTYAVTFTPSIESAESVTLSVGVVEDPNGVPPAIALSGTGLTPLRVVPASIAFGTVVNGHSSINRTVTVINEGGRPATSMSASITGANLADFAQTGGPCTSTLFGGGASCTYLLRFRCHPSLPIALVLPTER